MKTNSQIMSSMMDMYQHLKEEKLERTLEDELTSTQKEVECFTFKVTLEMFFECEKTFSHKRKACFSTRRDENGNIVIKTKRMRCAQRDAINHKNRMAAVQEQIDALDAARTSGMTEEEIRISKMNEEFKKFCSKFGDLL